MHLGHGGELCSAGGRAAGHLRPLQPWGCPGSRGAPEEEAHCCVWGQPLPGVYEAKKSSEVTLVTQHTTGNTLPRQWTNSCLPGTAARGLGPGCPGHRKLAQVQGCGAPSQETKAEERGERLGRSSLLSVGFYEAIGLWSQRPESKGCWQGANPQQPRVKALQSEAKLPG